MSHHSQKHLQLFQVYATDVKFLQRSLAFLFLVCIAFLRKDTWQNGKCSLEQLSLDEANGLERTNFSLLHCIPTGNWCQVLERNLIPDSGNGLNLWCCLEWQTTIRWDNVALSWVITLQLFYGWVKIWWFWVEGTYSCFIKELYVLVFLSSLPIIKCLPQGASAWWKTEQADKNYQHSVIHEHQTAGIWTCADWWIVAWLTCINYCMCFQDLFACQALIFPVLSNEHSLCLSDTHWQFKVRAWSSCERRTSHAFHTNLTNKRCFCGQYFHRTFGDVRLFERTFRHRQIRPADSTCSPSRHVLRFFRETSAKAVSNSLKTDWIYLNAVFVFLCDEKFVFRTSLTRKQAISNNLEPRAQVNNFWFLDTRNGRNCGW